MWFFFRRSREQQQAQAQTTPAKPRPLSYQQITQGFGNFSNFRTHDVALKFWLPEPDNEALSESLALRIERSPVVKALRRKK